MIKNIAEHADGFLNQPTILLDDEIVVKDGTLIWDGKSTLHYKVHDI